MIEKDLSLIGAKIAAADIRCWARLAAISHRPEITTLILEALEDGLQMVQEKESASED